VLPLVSQTHALLPERTRSVLTALYDVTLDLFAASLLGENARLPLVERLWHELLPRTTGLLARRPQQVAGSLCNAMFQVANQPGAKPDVWLERMASAATQCGKVSELLEAGKLAAWQAGMAQYRSAALESLTRLPASLGATLLGLPSTTTPEQLAAALERLAKHPWLTAESALQEPPEPASLSTVGTVGAFSGFGGVFARPPIIDCRDGRLVASDGSLEWELFADAYGTWFRRLGPSPKRRVASPGQPAASIDRRGTLRWNGLSLELPFLAEASSFASDGATLGVTTATSHHLFLFASMGSRA
jgi:hypothetical protein